MPTGNDATNMKIASCNCALCTVAGMAGKTAGELMTRLYGLMGKTVPTGVTMDDDGAMAFAEFYAIKTNKGSVPDEQTLTYQIEGVRLFYSYLNHTTKVYGTVKNPMQIDKAEETANKFADGTRFVVLVGEELVPTWGFTSAHWIGGQVQNGKAQYFDWQTKVTNLEVRQAMAKKYGKTGCKFDDTTQSDHMIAPLGGKLNEDSRALIIEMTS